jgi:hypothetical protein
MGLITIRRPFHGRFCALFLGTKGPNSHPAIPKTKKALVKTSAFFYGFFGGAEGGRTPDLMTASHALSQLSYSPES